MSNGGRAITCWVILCLCLALLPLSGCRHKAGSCTVPGEGGGVGDTPSGGGLPPGAAPQGAPPTDGSPATGTVPAAWRAEVWCVWPGSPHLEWAGAGCFLGGFAMACDGKPEFLLISLVAPGSDAPAADIVVLTAGQTRVVARLEDVADWHLTPDKRVLVGVQGSSFCSLAPDGGRSTLCETQGLHGADVLPGGQGMVLLEADAQGNTLSVVVTSAAGSRVVVERVADVPPEPEVGGRPVVPCRVSPDGSRVAFCGTRDGGSPSLLIIELETGVVTVIPVERPWGVVWAPNGGYVAVPGCGIFPAFGGPPLIALDNGESSIDWSPEGSYLLTSAAVIAVPGGSRLPLVDLGLKVPPAAQVRPLGWVAGAAPGGASAFVVVSWPVAQ